MGHRSITALLAGVIPLLAISLVAWGDGVDLTITNDSTDDIIVTVYDVGVRPQSVVLAHARLNGFTSVPLSITPDATGRAKLSWTAVSVDPNSRKCGHDDDVDLGSSGTLSVHADAACN